MSVYFDISVKNIIYHSKSCLSADIVGPSRIREKEDYVVGGRETWRNEEHKTEAYDNDFGL
jgi:hypothetical protein